MDYCDIWKDVKDIIVRMFDGQQIAPGVIDRQKRRLSSIFTRHGEKTCVKFIENVDNLLREQVGKILQSLEFVHSEMILEEFCEKCSDYHKSLLMVEQNFSFSQIRYMRRRLHLAGSIFESGVEIWKEIFLESDALTRSIVNALLELVCKQRKGEVVNKGLIKGVTQRLRSLGSIKFENLYEKPFLEATRQFYESVSQQLIMETGGVANEEYKKKAESIMEEEIDRHSFYSDSETEVKKLKSILKKVFQVTMKHEVV